MSRIKYAMDAITSFSYKPLRFSFALAALCISSAAVLAVFALVSDRGAMKYGLLAAISFMSSLPLLSLGILGEYLGRIYDEVRQRPLSIIQRIYRNQQACTAAEVRPEVAGHRLGEMPAEEFPAA